LTGFNFSRRTPSFEFELETEMKPTVNVKQLNDQMNNCPTFEGTTGIEYLIFKENWLSYMRHHSVDEIITKGTFHGEVLRDSRVTAPEKLVTIVEYQHQEIENDLKERKIELTNLLLQEAPWLVYWWDNTPLPIGHPSHQHRVTKRTVLFQDVSAAEVMRNVRKLPLGNFEGQNLILGPLRGALADEFYPDTVEGDLDRIDLIAGPPLPGGGAGNMIANPNAEVLPESIISDFIDRMLKCHFKAYCWNYQKVYDSIYVARTRTIESYYTQLKPTTRNLIERIHHDLMEKFSKHNAELTLINKTCSLVFNKIGHATKLLATVECEEKNYYAAFMIIENYFKTKASANTEKFADLVREMTLAPGQEFSNHWILLQHAMKNWAIVLGIQRDQSVAAAAPAPIVGVVAPIAPPPAAAVVVHQEEATANSGLLTDYEIENLGFRCLICEQDRINIVIKSISLRKERFTSSLDFYYQPPQSERSLRQLIEILKTREESKLGQEARDIELKHANRLTKNESSNGKTAMVTKNEIESSQKKFPAGSCVNHPNSTTHDTSGCNGGKQQKKSESSSSEKKTYTKPFETRNCGRCERWNPKRSAFKTHNSTTCTFPLPSDPNAKQFPVANLASSESSEKEPRKRKSKSKKSEPSSHYAPQLNTESDGETEDELEKKKSYIMNNLDEFAEFLNKKSSPKKQRN
jgi:hypothetical protein